MPLWAQTIKRVQTTERSPLKVSVAFQFVMFILATRQFIFINTYDVVFFVLKIQDNRLYGRYKNQ